MDKPGVDYRNDGVRVMTSTRRVYVTKEKTYTVAEFPNYPGAKYVTLTDANAQVKYTLFNGQITHCKVSQLTDGLPTMTGRYLSFMGIAHDAHRGDGKQVYKKFRLYSTDPTIHNLEVQKGTVEIWEDSASGVLYKTVMPGAEADGAGVIYYDEFNGTIDSDWIDTHENMFKTLPWNCSAQVEDACPTVAGAFHEESKVIDFYRAHLKDQMQTGKLASNVLVDSFGDYWAAQCHGTAVELAKHLPPIAERQEEKGINSSRRLNWCAEKGNHCLSACAYEAIAFDDIEISRRFCSDGSASFTGKGTVPIRRWKPGWYGSMAGTLTLAAASQKGEVQGCIGYKVEVGIAECQIEGCIALSAGTYDGGNRRRGCCGEGHRRRAGTATLGASPSIGGGCSVGEGSFGAGISVTGAFPLSWDPVGCGDSSWTNFYAQFTYTVEGYLGPILLSFSGGTELANSWADGCY
jgi:hypothetical protein